MIPKINETAKYETKIPSTGKKVKYRPYFVKEEKILLGSMESQNYSAGYQAVVDTIEACIFDDIDTKTLTLFDIEYLFTLIRAKSVGEVVTLKMNCAQCGTENTAGIRIDNLNISEGVASETIKITNDISIEMACPKYLRAIQNLDLISDKTSVTDKKIEMILESIVAICTPEERIIAKDEPKEELSEFIQNMTVEQFEKLYDFVENIPRIEFHAKFNCLNCRKDNTRRIKETKDFF